MSLDLSNIKFDLSAQFYKLKKSCNKKFINTIFNEVSKKKSGRTLLHIVRESCDYEENHIEYSIIVFKRENQPNFLVNTALLEIKYSYLMIIEFNDFLVVSKKNMDSVESKLSGVIEEFGYEKFCNYLGDNNPEYEKLAMNNMTVSNSVIRARSLEAKNLNGLIQTTSASRSIPGNFRITINKSTFSIEPNTSRVNKQGVSVGFDDFLKWCLKTYYDLMHDSSTSGFMGNFAYPVELTDILQTSKMVGLLISLNDIKDGIEAGSIALQKKTNINNNVGFSNLAQDELEKLLNALNNPLIIKGGQIFFKGVPLRSKVTPQKKVITIHVKLLDQIIVKENGQNDRTLSSYISNNKPYSIVFDNPTYAYYSKNCFADSRILSTFSVIENVLNDSKSFGNIKTEKEKDKLTPECTLFPIQSVFKKVEDFYDATAGVLICDDMNDEWADHIYFDTSARVPSLEFIHSKFSSGSRGASSLHEVVAQALKNIGRLYADKNSFEEKYNLKWKNNYESTAITRVRGGKSWSDIEKAFDTLYNNPESIRRIVLTVPFISKKDLITNFNKLANGGDVKPHYTQMLWLLNTFISACNEYGVKPLILCVP